MIYYLSDLLFFKCSSNHFANSFNIMSCLDKKPTITDEVILPAVLATSNANFYASNTIDLSIPVPSLECRIIFKTSDSVIVTAFGDLTKELVCTKLITK